MIATGQWRDLISAHANHKAFGFPSWPQKNGGGAIVEFPPAVWLEAIALHESSGNPRARHWDKPADPAARDAGDFEDNASFGLFQIEGRTFKNLLGIPAGFAYNFAEQLYLPAFNTVIAVRLLVSLLETFGDVDRALAAYNGGTWGAGRKDDGTLNDQVYVDFVRAAARTVQVDVA